MFTIFTVINANETFLSKHWDVMPKAIKEQLCNVYFGHCAERPNLFKPTFLTLGKIFYSTTLEDLFSLPVL